MKFIFIAIIALIIFGIIRHFQQKRVVTVLTEDEFREGYRKAQLIDCREPQEFDRGHILGSRNIPVTQLKQRLVELRKDKPVYLYCQRSTRSLRAANILHKQGFAHLNLLKGGFRQWNGKIKTK